MDFRNFLESVTIGHIDSGIDNPTLFTIIVVGIIVTIVQFATALVYNYDDNTTGSSVKLHTNLIFYIPLLILASSLELIVLVQCTFDVSAFVFTAIMLCVYCCIKGIMFCADERECMLGITAWVQELGVIITTKYSYLFQNTVDYYKSLYYIHKQQSNYLK